MTGTDEERFERLFKEQFGPVARYLLARADKDLASDALVRTFEVAWRRLGDVPPEPLGWLLGVARRVLSELRRAEGRRDALVERLSSREAIDTHVADVAELSLERVAALRALESLSSADREVLLLVAWEGLSEREAAAVLGCSRGGFALRLHRARRRLDALLRTAPGDQRRRANHPMQVHAAHHVLRTAATIEEAT